MKRILFLTILALIFSVIMAYEPFYVDDPAISPNGERVAFVYMSNLWEVSFQGGIARRLTATDDRIANPTYSPDGLWILFQSDRDGVQKLYRMSVSGGPAEVLSDESITFADWYPDGQSILGIMRIPGEQSSFVKLEIGRQRPIELLNITGSFATISDDGTKLVFDRRGLAFRPAYQGTHNGDFWLYDLETEDFTRLTDTPLTERYPQFSRIHKDRIYYTASDGKHFQLFYADDFDFEARRQLTFFEDWSARDISVSTRTDRVVFEYFKEIWSWNPETEEVRKIPITILEDNFPNPLVHQRFDSELTNFIVSQNQELVVFTHRFDLFAVPVRGGQVKQLTFEQAGIQDIAIMNDNETIYFLQNVRGVPKLFKTNIRDHLSGNAGVPPANNELIEWSSDKYLKNLWVSPAGELIVRYDRHTERNVYAVMDTQGRFTTMFPDELVGDYVQSSPEKGKIIYSSLERRGWVWTLKIANFVNGRATADTIDIFKTTLHNYNLMLSEDENHLIFGFNHNINIVSLVNEWKENEDNWDRIVPRRASLDIQQPVSTDDWNINSENFPLRNRVLVDDAGTLTPIYAASDSTLYYIQTHNGNSTLKSIKFDGSKKEDVFNFRGNISNYQLLNDNNTLFYVMNSRLHKLTIKGKQSTSVDFEYRYVYNVERLNRNVFEHVWGRFGNFYYDPDMHGQDWEEMYQFFEPLIHEIRDVYILQRFVDEMIGRVNSSHTGFHPRTEGYRPSFTPAFAGFVPDFRTRLPVGIRIKKIYFGSELHQIYNITDNDIILEINGTPLHSDTAIAPLFLNQVGNDINFRIQTQRGVVNATVKGISFSEQSQLRYENMVLENFRTVQELTDGKIGYIHIQSMNQRNLRRFEQDFWAKNAHTEGLIIDVRGNTGGNISGTLMEIITRPQRAYNYSREWGHEPLPTPSNIYQKPKVALIDEDSFSDAEIFGTLFRDLNVGLVIGMPTSGSVIGTRPWPLFDGSSMRMPINGWFRLNMENMELVPTTPDILVPRLPGHIINGEDPQLMKAIEILLSSE